MRITSDGKVEIGAQTITTGAHTNFLFSVNGQIVCTEIVCTIHDWGNWPDYVFDKNYQLPSEPMGKG